MITGSSKRKSNNKESYNFNGPTTTTGQGNPFPLFYGRMFIGGQIVSSGIYSEDRS